MATLVSNLPLLNLLIAHTDATDRCPAGHSGVSVPAFCRDFIYILKMFEFEQFLL